MTNAVGWSQLFGNRYAEAAVVVSLESYAHVGFPPERFEYWV